MTWKTGAKMAVVAMGVVSACGGDTVVEDDGMGGGGSGGESTTSSGNAGSAPMPPNCSVCGEVFDGDADLFSLCGLQGVVGNGQLGCVQGTSCSLLFAIQQCVCSPDECQAACDQGACVSPRTLDAACLDCVSTTCSTELTACEQDAF